VPAPRALGVLALAGSLRRRSYNRALLAAAVELAPAELLIAVDAVFPRLPLFDEDLEQETGGGPEPVQELRRRVAAADALLVATPEYNQSLPGVLKNGLDWLSRGPAEVLAGKPIAILGASGGPWGTRLAQAALRQTLVAMESVVMPSPALHLRDAARLFDPDGALADEPTRARLAALLRAFAAWSARLGAGAATAEGAPGAGA
jgi:chromate reductase